MNTKPKISMIPSGYKPLKLYSILPNDGSQDFDYLRESNGTRVNKSGLIEEAQSYGGEELANPEFETSANWNIINQGTASTVIQDGYARIVTGGSYTEITTSTSMTANKLYRLDYQILENTAGNLGIFAYNNQTRKLPSSVGTHSFDFLANGTTLGIKRYGGSTDIKLAYVRVSEISFNIPRLNWNQVNCPSVLGEIEMTNKLTDSLSWSVVNNINATKELVNDIVAPDGTNTGVVKLTATSTNQPRLEEHLSILSSVQTYTWSVFVKKGEGAGASDFVGLSHFSSNAENCSFNLFKGEIENDNGTQNWAAIEYYGNGWYRIQKVVQVPTSASNNIFKIHLSDKTSYSSAAVGDFAYFWGFQIELGIRATSFIPTNGQGQVTRLRDDIWQPNNSYKLNNNTATFFFDFKAYTFKQNFRPPFVIRDSGSTKLIQFLSRVTSAGAGLTDYFLRINTTTSSGTEYLISDTETFIDFFNRHKVAITFSGLKYEVFLNGVKKKSGVFNNLPTWYGADLFNDFRSSTTKPSTELFDFRVYDEVLTDNELIKLTKQ